MDAIVTLPWLLIGVSLFATLLSTISCISIPGESLGKGPVHMTNLVAYPFIFFIVGYVLLPVYMRQRVTSAYELLEIRLGLSVRLLGAVLFLFLRLFCCALFVFFANTIGVWIGALSGVVMAVLISFSGRIFGVNERGLDPISFQWISPGALRIRLVVGIVACKVISPKRNYIPT